MNAFIPKLGALTTEAAVKVLAHETGTSIHALRQTLIHVCDMAHPNAIYIASHLDQVDQRMAALDEDCAQRRRALEEMEPPIQVGLIHTPDGPNGPQAHVEIAIDRWEPGAS